MRDVRWGTVERRNGCPEIGTVYGELYGHIWTVHIQTFLSNLVNRSVNIRILFLTVRFMALVFEALDLHCNRV